MILNVEQQKAIVSGEPVSLQVAGIDCVLVREDVYLRLDAANDTEPWSIEEMNALADEAEALITEKECHED